MHNIIKKVRFTLVVNVALLFLSLFCINVFAVKELIKEGVNDDGKKEICTDSKLKLRLYVGDDYNEGYVFGDKNNSGKLYQAVKEDNLEKLQSLLDSDNAPDILYECNNTLLHLAARYGYIEIAQLLLKKKCDVNKANDLGETPLHLAAHYGCYRMVEFLLNNNANLYQKDECGYSSIDYAASTCFKDVFDLLISHAASKYYSATKDDSATHSPHNNPLCLLHIVAHNLVLKQPETERSTGCFHRGGEQLKILKHLLSTGINVDTVDSKGTTALHIAAEYGSTEIIKLFIESGADINKTDNRGNTPMHYAVVAGKDTGEVPFHSREMSSLLETLRRGLDEREYEDNIDTKANIRLLVKEGADINAVNHKGQTPPYLAVMLNNHEFYETLKVLDTNSHSQIPEGVALIHLLAGHCDSEGIITILRSSPSEVKITDKEGNTPLHYVASVFKENKKKSISGNKCFMCKSRAYLHKEYTFDITTPDECGTDKVASNNSTKVLSIETEKELEKQGSDSSYFSNLSDEEKSITLRKNALDQYWSKKRNAQLFKEAISSNNKPVDSLVETIGPLVESLITKSNPHGALHKACKERVQVIFHRNDGSILKDNILVVHVDKNEISKRKDAVARKLDTVRTLIKEGADINARNHDGETPLHVAVHSGDEEVVNLLISLKVNLEIVNNKGLTPLQLADSLNKIQIIELLINQGADVNVIDNDGNTLLHLQVKKRDCCVAHMLLDNGGASLTIKNNKELTPKEMLEEMISDSDNEVPSHDSGVKASGKSDKERELNHVRTVFRYVENKRSRDPGDDPKWGCDSD